MVERERVDQRAEAESPGALSDGGQENAGRRCHAQRREMVLGAVVTVEAGAVVGFDQLEPVFVKRGERPRIAVDVVEDSEFEGHSVASFRRRLYRLLSTPSLRA